MINRYKNLAQSFFPIIPYSLEFNLLNLYSTVSGQPLRDQQKHKRLRPKMLTHIMDGLSKDAALCEELEIKRNSPNLKLVINHFISLLRVYKDYSDILRARKNLDYKLQGKENYPDYFKRKFHFQTDGYTSEHSARLYEHQVDILFAGMAQAMRRTLLEEFRYYRPKKVLELGCGTGIASEMLALKLPHASIDATDLSKEYISYAKKMRPYININYKALDAVEIEEKYDCIFHVFLLHELPSKIRTEVLKKQISNLNKDGKGIILESLQLGDVAFLDEVLLDFPKYYHEPFYKGYIEKPVEDELKQLGAKNIRVTKRLFSKVVSFKA